MAVLRLRGQSLSVLISAIYLADGGACSGIELAREDVDERQIVLQNPERLTSLMWKAIGPVLTREWDAWRVAFGGATQKADSRVALLDSTQALIELEARPSVRIVEASDWPDQSAAWLPDLEDRRLEAKIVTSESLQGLREPVVVEVDETMPGSYAQYIPLGGGNTMFVRYRRAAALSDAPPRELADTILNRLAVLESFLLAEM